MRIFLSAIIVALIACSSFLLHGFVSGSQLPVLPSFNTTQLLGRWFQAYSDFTVMSTFEVTHETTCTRNSPHVRQRALGQMAAGDGLTVDLTVCSLCLLVRLSVCVCVCVSCAAQRCVHLR